MPAGFLSLVPGAYDANLLRREQISDGSGNGRETV